MRTEAFEKVAIDKILITADSQSGHVSKLTGIGSWKGNLAVPLPVERRYGMITMGLLQEEI